MTNKGPWISNHYKKSVRIENQNFISLTELQNWGQCLQLMILSFASWSLAAIVEVHKSQPICFASIRSKFKGKKAENGHKKSSAHMHTFKMLL